MSDALLPPRALFRFAIPCRYRHPIWENGGVALGEEYRLLGLQQLDGSAAWADVRLAWSEAGIAFRVEVHGKRQTPWCRESRLDDSDGFHLWIDTRDTHSIHRAGRFCHRFVFLPAGGGRRLQDPVAEPLVIQRAREHPRPVRPGVLQAQCAKRIDGYILTGHVPGGALTGFDTSEQVRLGFTYAVLDRELGEQTFGVGRPFPYSEDPSVWGTLDLVR